MTDWDKLIRSGEPVPEWPYPVDYDKVNEIDVDVLVIGGGIAGCHAAINARREGVSVAVLEKGDTKRSGNGGHGVDHWNGAPKNPCSKITPTEWTQELMDFSGGWINAAGHHIAAEESWDALLDCERMGVQIRDSKDEFKGAAFRDEETKLMFAYDYYTRQNIRVMGHNMKPSLDKEMTKLGVIKYQRVMMTSLLTEGGKQGAKVIGATGVNVRTGEFYVFRAKATIITTGQPSRNWNFGPEQAGGGGDLVHLNLSGDGHAAAWNAGAEFLGMESSAPYGSGGGYVPYGVGNADNSWHGATIVDANGKEVPWISSSGQPLKTFEERFRPAPGEKFVIGSGVGVDILPRSPTARPAGIPEGITSGEYTLPFYADLASMPETERRAIFGLMVGNEGKTRTSVYDKLTKAGFDPDKDMLRVPVLPVMFYHHSAYWTPTIDFARNAGMGGLKVDWELKTNLEGLYAAGTAMFGYGHHSFAAATGRFAGRKAAQFAANTEHLELDQQQISAERSRCYAHVRQREEGVGWKELNVGITRVMREFCGNTITDATLLTGMVELEDLKQGEAAKAFAANPHELGRVLECQSVISTNEIILNASYARKASCNGLMYNRIDFPDVDPPEWRKWISIKKVGEDVKQESVPLDFQLSGSYSPDFVENYRSNCGK